MADADADAALELLGQVELFRDLTRKELTVIRQSMKEIDFPAGAVISAEGDKGGRMFLITEGTAQVTVRGTPRKPMGRGDYFGEISVIDELPRAATVTAETDVRTLSMTSFNFRPLVREHPDMAWKLLVKICGLLRHLDG